MWWQREYEEELKRVEDEALRNKIRSEAQPNRRTYGWLGVFAGLLLFYLVIFFAFQLMRAVKRNAQLPMSGRIIDIVAVALASGLAAVLWQFIIRRHSLKLLRKSLQRHGVPICIRCGYDMRHHPDKRCPECGANHDAAE